MQGLRVMGLVLMIVMVSADSGWAQRNRAYVGVQGGATSGDLFGGAVNTRARWGGTAGVFGGVRTSRNTLTGLEVNWVQKGGADVRLDYIEIPLIVGASAPFSNRRGRVRLYTGIGVGFKVGCNSASTLLNCSAARGTEWALPIGIGFAGGSDKATIGIDVRYSIGLSDAFSTSVAYNRSWQLRLVIGKPLARRGRR